MKTKTHVVIATPVLTNVHPDYAASREATRRMFDKFDIQSSIYVLPGCSNINLARSKMASEFLASNAGVLLFIDGDQGWEAVDALALVRGIEAGLGITGAPVAVKEFDWEAIRVAAKNGASTDDLKNVGLRYCFAFREEDVITSRGYVGPRKYVEARESDTGTFSFVRVGKLGTGMMAISRGALSEILKTHPALAYAANRSAIFNSEISKNAFIGEDWNFCELAEAGNIDIWLYPDAKVSHYGEVEFKGRIDSVDELARRQASKQTKLHG